LDASKLADMGSGLVVRPQNNNAVFNLTSVFIGDISYIRISQKQKRKRRTLMFKTFPHWMLLVSIRV
jgi:hypothetical protein